MTSAREDAVRLIDLLRREHHALAEFLVELAGFDREARWSELGHTSLFHFLVRELGLPNGPAYYRKTAAELIQRYPELVDPLRDGRLHLTSIVELSKVITPENHREVVPRFFHASKREAKDIAAELQPAEALPVRTVVTALERRAPALDLLATPAPSSSARGATALLPEEPPRASSSAPAPAPMLVRSRGGRAEVEPLTADLRRLHVTVSRRLLDKLAAARDVLSHSHPGASEDGILELGLDLLLERYARRRGLGAKPRQTKAPAAGAAAAAEPPRTRRSRHVPADVWRAVWKRDGGRCAWKLDGGGVCGSTLRLELDHVHGFALGAGTTVDECRLLCRHHQDVAARRL